MSDLIEGYVSGSRDKTQGGSGIGTLLQHAPLALDIDGAHPTTGLLDTLLLTAQTLTATSDTYASLSWIEVR